MVTTKTGAKLTFEGAKMGFRRSKNEIFGMHNLILCGAELFGTPLKI